jgi:hypothetical protein
VNFTNINILEQQNIIDYTGLLCYETINQLVRKLKEETDRLGETLATYKRILIIMVETLENANKYLESHRDTKELSSQYLPFFKIIKNSSSYFIRAGNLIKNEDQAIIQAKIDQMNNLDRIELKKLYRQIIANGEISREGGAGLGFIEIAKSCDQKIQYSFEKIDESYKFYFINLELISKRL